MTKDASSGEVYFKCRCTYVVLGTPEDTLMSEIRVEADDSNLKHEVFIENAAHDPAGQIVMRDCPQCKLDFMTLIRVGINEQVLYTCTCGYTGSAPA